MPSSPAPLPSLGLLDGLGTAVVPATDSPAFLPSLGLLGGLGGTVAPAFGTITPAATSITFVHTGGGTHYRIYETGGAAGSWVALGASPVTASPLTTNQPYTIDLSSDGSTVAATVDTGTTNPGGGGGGVALQIDGGIGEAAASGLSVSIALNTGIAAGVGEAAASGLGAGISLGSNVTIAAGVALAEALGLGAEILLSTNIAAAVGAAEASGLPATITVASGTTIEAGVGEAAATGLAATITVPVTTTISCSVGAAEALGLRAVIRTLGDLPAYADQPTTASSWSYKRTATLWALDSRDEWGGQVTFLEPVLFLCDYAADNKRAVSAAGDEFTTRLLVYTSLPGIKQGDMVLIEATAEVDPYLAGAHEVRAVTEFGDTFSASGPPDFRIAT